MNINKRALQFFSALLILVFHIWIPAGNNEISDFLIKTSYIGVDIFFFLAAYSLTDREIGYTDFLKDRFLKIYGKYLVFVFIAAAYRGWSISRIAEVITGIEFFKLGGGAFLWFVPAIMIFYLIYPLITKSSSGSSIYALCAWAVFTAVSQFIFGYTKIFIFTNRIPVIIAGRLAKRRPLPDAVNVLLIPSGIALLYIFGFYGKLNFPFKEMYYVTAIPLVLGIAWLSGYIPKNRITDILSSCTLEMYGIQMIFGTQISQSIYSVSGMIMLTNILTIVIIWTVSAALHYVFSVIYKKIMLKE